MPQKFKKFFKKTVLVLWLLSSNIFGFYISSTSGSSTSSDAYDYLDSGNLDATEYYMDSSFDSERHQKEQVSNRMVAELVESIDAVSPVTSNQNDDVARICPAESTAEPTCDDQTSHDDQDNIDHVTNLIKSMRSHAIEIIKSMNDLETDLLAVSDDDCPNSNNCNNKNANNKHFNCKSGVYGESQPYMVAEWGTPWTKNVQSQFNGSPVGTVTAASGTTAGPVTVSVGGGIAVQDAQDAIKSWKGQIETCKHILDAAVAQAQIPISGLNAIVMQQPLPAGSGAIANVNTGQNDGNNGVLATTATSVPYNSGAPTFGVIMPKPSKSRYVIAPPAAAKILPYYENFKVGEGKLSPKVVPYDNLKINDEKLTSKVLATYDNAKANVGRATRKFIPNYEALRNTNPELKLNSLAETVKRFSSSIGKAVGKTLNGNIGINGGIGTAASMSSASGSGGVDGESSETDEMTDSDVDVGDSFDEGANSDNDYLQMHPRKHFGAYNPRNQRFLPGFNLES